MSKISSEQFSLKKLKKAIKFIRDMPAETPVCYPPPFPKNEDLYRWIFWMNETRQRVFLSTGQLDGYVKWLKDNEYIDSLDKK